MVPQQRCDQSNINRIIKEGAAAVADEGVGHMVPMHQTHRHRQLRETVQVGAVQAPQLHPRPMEALKSISDLLRHRTQLNSRQTKTNSDNARKSTQSIYDWNAFQHQIK